MKDTMQALREAAEHAPAASKIADGLRGWWTPAGWYVCSSCSSRIIGRGFCLPSKSEPVWKDGAEPFGVCCVCEAEMMKPSTNQNTTTMSKMTDLQQTAADHIHAIDNGDGTVTYYDDGTQQHYVCPYADLSRLWELLNADGDEYPARDAYSLWCAEYSHATA